MTKKEFKAYSKLPQERDYLICKIERMEKALDAVPIVKTKVQASEKEWPYIETHVTVDAPEPVRYSSLKRDIRRSKLRLETVEKRMDRLTKMIDTIEDSRTRQIITERYIEGRKLMDVAAKFNLTDQHVMRIIGEAIKNF